MAEDLSETIAQNAQGPESVEVDGVRVKQHPLRDQIEADKHVAARKARRNPAAGLVRYKLVPPGAV